MSDSKDNAEYQIDLEKKTALHGWQQLEEQFPSAMQRCREFLTKNPINTIKSRGKAKKLKGSLKWLYQYDVTDSDRVWYWVDKQERVVKIEYAGPHP